MSDNTVSSTEKDKSYDFCGFASAVKHLFDGSVKANPILFTTDVNHSTDLFDTYLSNFPEFKQEHNCSCCRSFITRFGGLVCIDDEGKTYSPLWDSEVVPTLYSYSVEALRNVVKKAKVTGVFLTSQETLGVSSTVGDYLTTWIHFSVNIPYSMRYGRSRVLNAGQAMASKRENFKTVIKALSELTSPILDSAIFLLNQEKLNRSEKFIGPVKWLRDLQDRPKGPKGDNLLWKAIATAPEGYCHPRSSVVNTLLEDIEAKLPFDVIRDRFAEKTRADRYQRPQAAPSLGNIKAAEAIIEKLGIQRSLERRFARIEDIQKVLWTPTVQEKKKHTEGFFSHLVPKDAKDESFDVVTDSTDITWEKFARTILPDAKELQFKTPFHGNYCGLTTAVHADAPPILKWDSEEERNPVAWYLYVNGSQATHWGLAHNSWINVNLITPLPTTWGKNNPMPHLAEGAILILDGAMDTLKPSSCLFPENLKEDLHSVRSTIEAHSNATYLAGSEYGDACGYSIRKGVPSPVIVRAKTSSVWSTYKIDRWD